MEHATIERSFRRGACLALGLLSLDRLIKVDTDSVLEHMLDLNDYREWDESFSSAALRIGFYATYADTTMARNIFEVGQLYDQTVYDPVVMQHGASYMQLIAERHLQKLSDDELVERSRVDPLQFEFGQDLNDLSRTFEAIIEDKEQ